MKMILAFLGHQYLLQWLWALSLCFRCVGEKWPEEKRNSCGLT
jgi:hypothetical protein